MVKLDDRVSIRPIKSDDIKEFYGTSALRRTCRGWSVYLDGELAGICGITIGRSIVVAFSEIKPGLPVSRRIIWNTAVLLMDMITDLGFSIIYAIADPRHDSAPSFLRHLGFEHIESSVRGEVFRWQAIH